MKNKRGEILINQFFYFVFIAVLKFKLYEHTIHIFNLFKFAYANKSACNFENTQSNKLCK